MNDSISSKFPACNIMPWEQDRVTRHCTRAKIIHMPATLTYTEWICTILDFNGMCAYCLKNPFAVLEHFYPVEMAGTTFDNCLPACRRCNNKKAGILSKEALIFAIGQETFERIQDYFIHRSSDSYTPPDYRPITTKPEPEPKEIDTSMWLPLNAIFQYFHAETETTTRLATEIVEIMVKHGDLIKRQMNGVVEYRAREGVELFTGRLRLS